MKIIPKITTVLIVLSFYHCPIFSQEQYYKSGTKSSELTNIVWAAKWFNDKKSAFSFSFDDGTKSQYDNAAPILNQYNFNGTFYVIPNYLTDTLPGIWRYGTWQMFTQMANEGHEIGSHSMNHLHLQNLEIGDTSQEGTILYELYQSKKLIEERISNQKCITLAYPYAEHNDLIDSLASLFYESARVDGDSINSAFVTGKQLYTLSSYEVRFSEPRTVPADDFDELVLFENWIDSLITKEGWGILLGHEVVPFDSIGGLWHPFSIEWFAELCDWIRNKSEFNDVWIGTVANVTRYLKERINCYFNLITYNESQIQLEADDSLNNEIYNHPLTVYIKVPEDWKSALLIQGNIIDTITVLTNDSGKVAMVNIIPGGDLISLYKMNINGIKDNQNQAQGFDLFPNYPNPFNPSTTIKFVLASTQYVKLMIFDLLGNEVATLVDEYKKEGSYSIYFNAENLVSGVYIYSLRAGNKNINRKMILLK